MRSANAETRGLRLVTPGTKATPWRLKLTDAEVRALKLPRDKDAADVWDTVVKRFGVRLTLDKAATEANRATKMKDPRVTRRTWQVLFRVRGQLRRLKLGDVDGPGAIGLKAARDLATSTMVKAKEAVPATGEHQEAGTFGALVDAFFVAKEAKLRKSTLNEWRRLYRPVKQTTRAGLTVLAKKRVDAISRDDAEAALRRIKSRSVANRTHTVGSVIYQWAKDTRRYRGDSPFDFEPLYPEDETGRALTADELRVIWRAIQEEGGDFADVFTLLFLTGVRLRMVLHMRRDELRLEDTQYGPHWFIPGARTKNQKPHVVPLVPAAVEILRRRLRRPGDYVFPSPRQMRQDKATGEWRVMAPKPINSHSRAVTRIKARADKIADKIKKDPLARWRTHDIRHTIATTMLNSLGVDGVHIAFTLGHSVPLPPVTLRYAHSQPYTRMPERRAAIEQWVEWLAKVTAEADAQA